MNEKMQFPNTFEEFLNGYSFRDREEVYTNGCELIPTFRVMQGYEHFVKQGKADAIEELLKELCIGCAYLNGTKCEIKGGCPCSIGQSEIIRSANKVLEQMQKGAENESE